MRSTSCGCGCVRASSETDRSRVGVVYNETTDGLLRQDMLRRLDFRTLTKPTSSASPTSSPNDLDRHFGSRHRRKH